MWGLHSGYNHALMREWQKEKSLSKSSLVYPLFISDQFDQITEIKSLPGISRFSHSIMPNLLKSSLNPSSSSFSQIHDVRSLTLFLISLILFAFLLISRFGVGKIVEHLTPLVAKGLQAVLIFGVPETGEKDEEGSSADSEKGPVVECVKLIRKTFPSLLVACDLCLCAYTSHGHCGILCENGVLDNAASVKRLATVALGYAKAGFLLAPDQ